MSTKAVIGYTVMLFFGHFSLAMELETFSQYAQLCRQRCLQITALVDYDHIPCAITGTFDPMPALQTLARSECQTIMREYNRFRLPVDTYDEIDAAEHEASASFLSNYPYALVSERTQHNLMRSLFDIYVQMYEHDPHATYQLYMAIVAQDVSTSPYTRVLRSLLTSWAHERAVLLVHDDRAATTCRCAIV